MRCRPSAASAAAAAAARSVTRTPRPAVRPSPACTGRRVGRGSSTCTGAGSAAAGTWGTAGVGDDRSRALSRGLSGRVIHRLQATAWQSADPVNRRATSVEMCEFGRGGCFACKCLSLLEKVEVARRFHVRVPMCDFRALSGSSSSRQSAGARRPAATAAGGLRWPFYIGRRPCLRRYLQARTDALSAACRRGRAGAGPDI